MLYICISIKIVIYKLRRVDFIFINCRLHQQNDLLANRDEGSCDDDYDSLGDYTSNEDVEEEKRMAENAVTMNKMADLKKQLQNLSMSRKNNQVNWKRITWL